MTPPEIEAVLLSNSNPFRYGVHKLNELNKMRKSFMNTNVLGTLLFVIAPVAAVAENLAPPPYEVMNRHGVNVASGHVSPSLKDVSIGNGTLGLSHAISSFSSNFSNWEGDGPLGYRDQFYGRVMKVIHHKPPNTNYNSDFWVWVMRVFDIGSSVDFSINANGTYTAYNGDPRNTLEFVTGVGFVWTKPDGTMVTYRNPAYVSSGNNYEIAAGLSEIKYPNGFVVTVTSSDIGARVLGVTTNTGYQLKYIYIARSEVLELPDDPSNDRIPPVQTGWSSLMPRYVVGINNAVDYCPTDNVPSLSNSISEACAGRLTQEWPKATYTWPSGMPRVMYLGDTVFSVMDSGGGVTDYASRPFKKNPGCDEQDPKYRAPRIVSIKSSTANVPSIYYDYQSYCVSGNVAEPFIQWAAGPVAQLKNSYIGTDSHGYSLGNPYTPAPGAQPTTLINGSGGYRGINYVYSNIDYGLMKFDAWDRFVTFEQARSNRLQTITDKLTGVVSEFGYDARHNVTSIKKNGLLVQSAGYPVACDNRKTCNQATWIRDANGNQTDYEYDTNSGQVARVRMPADKDGVRAEIRYSYDARYAYYKDSTGNFRQAPSPVFLLMRERKCLKTATIGDGSGCVGGAQDEVITDYDYGLAAGPNNLNLRGVAVTAYVDGSVQVRRSCYAYDAYGNRIGETKPKAGLTSCP